MTMRYSHLLTEHLHEAVAKAGTKLGTRAPASMDRSAKLVSTEALAPSFSGAAYFWIATAKLENGCTYNIITKPAYQGLEPSPEPC
jgi:hypothetical protein